jgi:hypothetical protein
LGQRRKNFLEEMVNPSRERADEKVVVVKKDSFSHWFQLVELPASSERVVGEEYLKLMQQVKGEGTRERGRKGRKVEGVKEDLPFSFYHISLTLCPSLHTPLVQQVEEDFAVASSLRVVIVPTEP